MTKAQPTSHLTKRTIWIYRLLSFFTGVIIVVLPFLIPPEEHIDPLWQRFLLGGILMVYPVLSFFSPWIRKNTYPFTYINSFLVCIWLMELMFLNNFSLNYAPTYFIALCLTSFIFRDFRSLLICFGLQLGAAFAFYALPAAPLVSPIYIYMLQIMIMVGLAFLIDRQITERKKLISKASRLEEIAVAAFEYSGDGILVSDREGRVLQTNPRFLEIWNLRSNEISYGEKGAIFEKVKANILDLESWENVFQDASDNPEKYVFQAFSLVDGRHVERFSRPLYLEKGHMGRIWFYKDVTEAKRKTDDLKSQKEFLESANQALVEFSTSDIVQKGERNAALQEIVRVSTQILNIEGSVVWWQNTAGGPFEVTGQTGLLASMFEELSHSSVELPQLIRLMEGSRVLEVNSKKGFSELNEIANVVPAFRENASLQVPIRVEGKIKGLISLMSTTERNFNADERAFAGSMGNVVTAVLEAAQRRIAEQELANNLAILTSVFEMSGLGIVVTTIGGSVLDYNADFVNMWDLSPSMLEPGGGQAMVAKIQASYKDHDGVADTLAFKFDHPAQSRFDVLQLKDGRVIERTTRGLWVEGLIKGRIWYYQDVTQRVRSREALHSSETRNRALVNAVPDLMLRLHHNGELIDQRVPENTLFYDLFKNAPQTLSDVFPADLCKKMLSSMEEVKHSGKLKGLDFQMEWGDTPLDLEIRMVQSGDEEVLAMVRDVSERKTTERELIQRNFELDSFVYRASHDLKAPLNSLMGIIDILVNEDLPSEVRSYIQLMDRSVVKLDTFIRNLTDFSRIARLEIKGQEINLQELYQEILESLKFMENADRVEKNMVIQEEAPLRGDRFHIGIVLSNLLSNAIKYQDHQKSNSKIDVLVKVTAIEVLLEIKDNGIGIPEQYQERLFELFFRASNQSFGSGLGLYITKNAVEKMDGRIELESQAGIGTRFTIVIPNHVEDVVLMEVN